MYFEDINYYEGYLLENGVYNFELSDDQKDFLNCCIWIIDNKVSIRNASKNFQVSKSTLHRKINKELKSLSYELYTCVKRQLLLNKEKYFK